ncbi:hypothetical protein SXIM_00002 [Streptomyces xiamenensis]|uniref:Uncharacterized protein n=1 Tax=Streptomyces xiamenensis TaxID=408015 RepID=A0A0R8L9P0_9ACTN|nr:hypothetical protein SXIM_00002 [Streptomyces xiamenensis]
MCGPLPGEEHGDVISGGAGAPGDEPDELAVAVVRRDGKAVHLRAGVQTSR